MFIIAMLCNDSCTLDAVMDRPESGLATTMEQVSVDDLEEVVEKKPVSFECRPCKKKFKSEGQFLSHEKSKKHIKTMKKLGFA